MNNKLYSYFAIVAIASAVISFVRLVLGQDAKEVVTSNIIIGGICLVMIVLLSYKERRQIARRN